MTPKPTGGTPAAPPEPLVGPDVDLTGFPRFMLDADRLLGSELFALATGEEFRAAVALWCRAWKQTPPASLPDDDRILSAFSGTGKRWPKVREMALRGFLKCSDGRLYHPLLAADAKISWEKRKKYQDRSAKAHAKRWSDNAAQPVDIVKPDDAYSTAQAYDKQSISSAIDRDRDRDSSKKEKTLSATAEAAALPVGGSEKPKPEADPAQPPSEGYTAEFESWWAVYPLKDGKGAAFKAFKLAKKRTTLPKLMAGVAAYAKARHGQEPRYTKRAATWLTGDGWNDEAPKKGLPVYRQAANGG